MLDDDERCSPAEWWRFAYTATMEGIRRRNERSTWAYAVERAKQLNVYAQAYALRLESAIESAKAADTIQALDGHSNESSPRYCYVVYSNPRAAVTRRPGPTACRC